MVQLAHILQDFDPFIVNLDRLLPYLEVTVFTDEPQGHNSLQLILCQISPLNRNSLILIGNSSLFQLIRGDLRC